MARAVWKPKPKDPVRRVGPLESELTGRRHRHGCSICSHVYEDLCETPMTDGSCSACRGHTRPIWESGLEPRDCCLHSVKADPQEMTTYRLGGDGTWWLCPTCKRPHTHKPRKAAT